MRSLVLALIVLMLSALALSTVQAAPVGIPILIDLTHGQPSSGIEIIMRMVPEAQWYILVKSEEDKEALSPLVKSLAHGIIVGDFASISLEKYRIQMIIIGQPQSLFTPDEISPIVTWFKKYPNRAIWLAADSDYPAQGSETAQHAVNMVLEALGAKIRMDYVSIEDEESKAIKTYRVLGIVNPDPEVAIVGYACEKVLFHGPGGVAWIDEAGNWHKLTKDDKPDNVYIIVTTSDKGKVAEHQAEPRGTSGKAYTPGESGVFTLMAVELIKVGEGYGKVILSSESPYGGYQPLTTWMYYGFVLSGPQFVRNVILWATGYMGELKGYEKIVKEVSEKVTEEIESLKGKVAEYDSKIASANSTAMAALGVGVIGIIIGIVAIVFAMKKS